MTMTAAFPVAAYNIRPSRATGPDASAIDDRVAEVGKRLATTETYGRILQQLAIDVEFPKSGERHSVAPHPGSVDYATRFLRRMPYDVVTPDIDIDDDGEVAFEWIIEAGRRLSITFSPRGRINYSGLFDGGEAFGAEWFDDEIPESILRCIRRLVS